MLELERCESGRIGRPAKALYPSRGTGGSNPPLSEKNGGEPRTEGNGGGNVPIAQLDRALDCGSKGRRFESSWARRSFWERCESGRIGRSRKPLSCLRLRGFESHSLRETECDSPVGVGRSRTSPTLTLKAVSARHGSWRDDRVAEGARLEGVCTRKGTVGSNPTLSVQPLRWRSPGHTL
jgi:hypothetical protein